MWYCVEPTGGAVYGKHYKKLWYRNTSPEDDCRERSLEMKQVMEYMIRHHNDLMKSMTDGQKEILERFHDCWSEHASLSETR